MIRKNLFRRPIIIEPKKPVKKSPGKEFELTTDQQWERVNIVLLITALIFFLNTLGLLTKLYFDGFFGDYEDVFIQKTLYVIQDQTVGFPMLHLAILTNTGLLDDFSLDGTKNRTFLKLQARPYILP